MGQAAGESIRAGETIRMWRRRRSLSQLDLSHRAGVSTRHLSFIETGRSRPSDKMVLRLCDELQVPLREQNLVLLAAGHAPAHPEHALADPPMAAVSAAIEGILAAHLPFPALVVDRGWDLVSANTALDPLLEGVAPRLLEPPVNVIRLTLHPDGLAPRIVNMPEWRDHLVHRLRREHDLRPDPRLAGLLAELGRAQPVGPPPDGPPSPPPTLLVPLRIRLGEEVLSLVSATTVFGTPREVTLSELAIETLYPADEATRAALLGG